MFHFIIFSKYVHTDASKFEEIESFSDRAQSLIECTNFASIFNQEHLTSVFASNAFKYDEEAKICVVGKIDMVDLRDVQDRDVVSKKKNGIYMLQQCQIKGM